MKLRSLLILLAFSLSQLAADAPAAEPDRPIRVLLMTLLGFWPQRQRVS